MLIMIVSPIFTCHPDEHLFYGAVKLLQLIGAANGPYMLEVTVSSEVEPFLQRSNLIAELRQYAKALGQKTKLQ